MYGATERWENRIDLHEYGREPLKIHVVLLELDI